MSILDGLIGPDTTFERGFGDRLANARDEAGFTNATLAQSAAVSVGVVSSAVDHAGRVNARAIINLCLATGISPNDLFGWEGLVEARIKKGGQR